MKKLLWLLVLIPVIGVLGFVVWAQGAAAPMPEALAALQSNSQVRVETSPWLTFQPEGASPTTGLIFYPGGKVDARAYAPAAQAIAAQGYLVVIPPMPLNLAVFGINKASDVIAAHPEIQHWAVGGHSLGGSMAASFARQHAQQVQGLVLWASYPASSDDLSKLPLKVVSVSGALDGLATPEKIQASRPLLPPDTNWVEIPGGDHAQFGWYGPQSGDQPATISRPDQQAQVVQASVLLLQGLTIKP